MREFPAIANEIRDWPLEHLWDGGGGDARWAKYKKNIRGKEIKGKKSFNAK